MTVEATAALAPAFDWTTATVDLSFAFASGTSPVVVTIPSSRYRVWLSASGSCFLRVIAAAVAARLTLIRGASYTCIASLSTAGVYTLRIISGAGVPTGVTIATGLWQRLGMASATPTLSVAGGSVDIVGTLPVWHLALLSSLAFGPWQPKQAGGSEQTPGGVVYTIAASGTSYQRKHKVTYQPTTPTHRTAQGAEASPLQPELDDMGDLGVIAAREPSVLDTLQAARNAVCGFTPDWRTLRVSTSDAYYIGYASGDTVLSPELTAMDETWDAWSEWVLGFVLPTANMTGTRA